MENITIIGAPERATVAISNVNLPQLEKQRKAFVKYTEHVDSFANERDGLENFLNEICDAWYHTLPISIAHSSHGTIDFNRETGLVLSCEVGDADLERIGSFDVEEYKKYHNVTELPDNIDILDLGYWLEDETYEPPTHNWR